MNVYDTANKLAQEIKESQEYKEYKSMKDEIMTNPELKSKIEEFEKLRYDIQLMQYSGEQKDEGKMKKLEDMYKILEENGFVLNVYRPKISKKEIATEWLNHNQSLVSRYVPQFFIAGKSTCCIVLIQNKDFPFAFGKAKCAASDECYEKVGKIISFCRAIGRPELIPKEFFE